MKTFVSHLDAVSLCTGAVFGRECLACLRYMLLPEELGPVMTLTLPCVLELWKELDTSTGEHTCSRGCLGSICMLFCTKATVIR